MATITAMHPARRRPGFVQLEVDGTMLGPISEREVQSRGLAVGQALDAESLADLEVSTRLTAALGLANAYLAHRPRTTSEVRQRLRQGGHADEVVDQAIDRLETQGLLDDRRFASLWVENRAAFSPRSSRVLEMELRRKGLDRETIRETLAEAAPGDEVQHAIEAGRKRLRTFASGDEDLFRQRMGGYLARRGFGYEVAAEAVRALWAEAGE